MNSKKDSNIELKTKTIEIHDKDIIEQARLGDMHNVWDLIKNRYPIKGNSIAIECYGTFDGDGMSYKIKDFGLGLLRTQFIKMIIERPRKEND